MRGALLLLGGCVACGGITSTDGDRGVGGGGGGGGGTGAVEPVATCSEAENLWQEALIVARDCNPLVDENECTKLVRADWACGCQTYVNASNADALAALSKMKQRLDTAAPKECKSQCVGDCAEPLYGICQSTGLGGNTGRCSDVYY